MKEAMFYTKEAEDRVRCHLCAHRCSIANRKKGICQVRENREGTLYTLVYGRTISQNIDPIEKKPLFHFYPASTTYSIATPGCNFRCAWCQNWEISQMPKQQHLIAGYEATPKAIVAKAKQSGCSSIAYTYTEPTIFFEYAYDIARLAREAGLANIFVTNGYMTGEMLKTFQPYLDAANVDLKAFRDQTYRKYVGALLQPVLDSLKLIKQLGIWLEVTTLVIPGINDDPAELLDAAQFILGELGADTPWHLSRFFPDYQLKDVPPTPLETMAKAWEIGKSVGLKYVYLGNLPSAEKQNTFCPDCGTLSLERNCFGLIFNHLQEGCCPNCGRKIARVSMPK